MHNDHEDELHLKCTRKYLVNTFNLNFVYVHLKESRSLVI